MSTYPALLSDMMDAILARDVAVAPTLFRVKEGFPPEAQLAVYTEGYRLRLADVIENTYPALRHALGTEAFAKLSADYIEAHPSRYFNIDTYAIGFAQYIGEQNQSAFACDLARFECALHEVYAAPESPSLTRDWIATQTMESLTSTVFSLRAAAQLHVFNYPVHTYLAQLRGGENPTLPTQAETRLLIYRHKHQVERLEMQAGEYALLTVLAEGITLMNALQDRRVVAYTEDEKFGDDLMRWCARWAERGCLQEPCTTP